MAWNSDQRNGQCHKPMAEVKFQGILHWKLRAFDILLQIFYRLIASVYVWGDKKKNARQMQFVSSAKQEAITHIRKTTGMLIELIPQLLKGGTPIQLKWQRGCHSDNRGAIYQLIKKVEDRENYEKLAGPQHHVLCDTRD